MEPDLTARPRIVFLSSGGVLGDTVLRRLLDSGRFDVVGVVRSRRVMLKDAGFLRGAIAYFSRCGVLYTVYIWLITTFAEALGWITRTGSITHRARRHHIPVLHSRNINSPEGLRFLRQLKPHILVSAHFDQPLHPPLCDGQEFAAVNLHPSALPADQGLEPVLHALREKRSNLGVTLHRTAARIDCGNIVAVELLDPAPTQSVFALMRHLMELGANMIVDHRARLSSTADSQPQAGHSSYHTWPTGRQVCQLYRAGYHLIAFRDARHFFVSSP